jgi:hypothetical protein
MSHTGIKANPGKAILTSSMVACSVGPGDQARSSARGDESIQGRVVDLMFMELLLKNRIEPFGLELALRLQGQCVVCPMCETDRVEAFVT